MTTYGMKNTEIVETTVCGTTPTFLVYADTKRFGKHEIMAQFPTRKEAEQWLIDNGVEPVKTLEEMVEEQVQTTGGRIQVGNMMFHNIQKEDGKVIGRSNTWGWCELDKFFEKAVVTGANVAKTTSGMFYGWQKSMTIKFGNACTW